MAAARALAARAHKGQRDKASRDYFDAHLVPIASAAAIFGPDVEAVAWLHDVLEDTDLSAVDLSNAGMPVGVVQGIESVTRLDNETYSHLIARACLDPIGRFGKLADNGWNITSNPVLAKVDPDRAASMLSRRYLPARQRLLHACGLELDSPAVREMQAVLNHHHERLQRTA
ncbi:phosphohydrolase [Mycolicibacterium sp.]|uniref:phosphohydrolase n=1 Tax=Mycolicibacterium sp. TaxID=2320850 RepID=UPI0037CA231D